MSLRNAGERSSVRLLGNVGVNNTDADTSWNAPSSTGTDRVPMIRASSTSFSRGDRFCPPAISPPCAEPPHDIESSRRRGTTDA
jgi:hypothetical protein